MSSLFVIVGESLESEGALTGQRLTDLITAILVGVVDELPE